MIFLYRFTFQRAGCQFCNHSSFFYVLHFYCQSVVCCYDRYFWPIVKKKRNWTHNNRKKHCFLNNKHNDVETWKSCDCIGLEGGVSLCIAMTNVQWIIYWCPQVTIQLRLWGQALLFYCTVPFKKKFQMLKKWGTFFDLNLPLFSFTAFQLIILSRGSCRPSEGSPRPCANFFCYI